MGRTWLPNEPLKVILGVVGVDDLVSRLLGGDGVVVVLLREGKPVDEVGNWSEKSWMACCESRRAACCLINSGGGRLPSC